MINDLLSVMGLYNTLLVLGFSPSYIDNLSKESITSIYTVNQNEAFK